MRALGLSSLVLSSLLLGRPAHAKLLDLYGGVKVGGVSGFGTGKLDMRSSDYYEIERGPAFGFELGAELLFIDVSATGTQMFDGDGTAGTFWQLLVGIDTDLPVDSRRDPRTFLRLGFNGGVHFGLHRKVDPPLSNDEVSDYGFVTHGIVAIEHHLGKLFIVGAEVNPGFHYFAEGGGAAINDSTNHSQGFQVMGFLTARVHFEPAAWSRK
jgi:hypothetical protein